MNGALWGEISKAIPKLPHLPGATLSLSSTFSWKAYSGASAHHCWLLHFLGTIWNLSSQVGTLPQLTFVNRSKASGLLFVSETLLFWCVIPSVWRGKIVKGKASWEGVRRCVTVHVHACPGCALRGGLEKVLVVPHPTPPHEEGFVFLVLCSFFVSLVSVAFYCPGLEGWVQTYGAWHFNYLISPWFISIYFPPNCGFEKVHHVWILQWVEDDKQY